MVKLWEERAVDVYLFGNVEELGMNLAACAYLQTDLD